MQRTPHLLKGAALLDKPPGPMKGDLHRTKAYVVQKGKATEAKNTSTTIKPATISDSDLALASSNGALFLSAPDSLRKIVDMGSCEQKLGYKFKNALLLWEALQSYRSTECAKVGMGELRERSATNDNLAKFGYDAGLKRFINSASGSTQDIPVLVMASTVEAIIGAVYLDGGLNAAKRVAHGLKIEVDEDYTDRV
ncbi:MAG: hypothetical protein Q9218_002232 [Villophora microphyllina]